MSQRFSFSRPCTICLPTGHCIQRSLNFSIPPLYSPIKSTQIFSIYLLKAPGETQRKKTPVFTVNTGHFGLGHQKRSRQGQQETFFLLRGNNSCKKVSYLQCDKYLCPYAGSVQRLREKVDQERSRWEGYRLLHQSHSAADVQRDGGCRSNSHMWQHRHLFYSFLHFHIIPFSWNQWVYQFLI